MSDRSERSACCHFRPSASTPWACRRRWLARGGSALGCWSQRQYDAGTPSSGTWRCVKVRPQSWGEGARSCRRRVASLGRIHGHRYGWSVGWTSKRCTTGFAALPGLRLDNSQIPLCVSDSDFKPVGQIKSLKMFKQGTPPGPTTHSPEIGRFLNTARKPRTGGPCRCEHGLRRDLPSSRPISRVVSLALEFRFPGRR